MVAVGPLRDAAAALCAVRAGVVEPRAARRVFYDRAHDRLHDLARAAELVDRRAAARLLEAKQAVERDLDAPASSSTRLAAALDRLLRATSATLTAISISPMSCAG
jgi:hypothetical protein